jgi:hypothetical protein
MRFLIASLPQCLETESILWRWRVGNLPRDWLEWTGTLGEDAM